MARYRRDKVSSGFAPTRMPVTRAAWRMAAFIFILLFTAPGFSAQGPAPNEPWHITADQLSFDDTQNLYIAEGDVVISRLDRKLTADLVRFNRTTMMAHARGNVIMTAGGDILTGERMEMNLEKETGTVYDGNIFIKATHFFLRGRTLKKTGEKTYQAEEATITTCDGDSPDWKITGKKLDVVVEGFGTIKHGTLWAKKIPVAYTPFFAFPVNRKRQTGLLTPEFGTSDRKGFEFNQPLFWAINDHSDATFHIHHMEKRGEKIGLEYRYILSEDFRGGIMFDFLDDKEVEDGTPSAREKWGYAGTPERTNDDRYWFRMKHDQRLPLGIDLALDLDIVSDADYLREFKSGYAGYKKTDAFFEKMFGRGLDEYDDTTRVNRLNLNRKWDRFNLNSEVRWYDDVIKRRSGETDATVQKLPSVELFGIRQKIAGTPLFFDLDSEFTYFHREDTLENQPRGLRADIYPRVYLPLSYGHLFTFEPSMGYRQTFWDLSETVGDQDESLSRGIYDIRLDLSSDMERVFDMDRWGIRKLRHSVKPAVVYEYIPEQGQEEYPSFEDDLDLIERRNSVTYSLTNTFTARSGFEPSSGGSFTGKALSDAPAASYRQIGRVKISQTYDFNEANENDPTKWRDGKDRRPFSPILMELEFSPSGHISFLADAGWSTYDSRMISHNIGTLVADRRGDSVYLEHRYNDDPAREGIENAETKTTESIYLKANLVISPAVSVYSEYERNLEVEEDILTRFGLVYSRQCWAVDLNYTDEEDDQRIGFLVNLHGLGGLGSEI